MKKCLLVVALMLGLTLSFTSNIWAQGETFECCCQVECYYTKIPLLCPEGHKTFDGCITYPEDQWYMCNEMIICRTQFIGCAAFYKSHTGQCDVNCPTEEFLGYDDPGLDILRQFRDEVLDDSENGKKLMDVYYKYGSELIDAFDENPGIGEFATEVLEKTITRLYEALGSEEELLTDEIATDIEILIDELDAVVASPELKKTMKQIKRDIENGTLLK